jgi:YndJ-like protein
MTRNAIFGGIVWSALLAGTLGDKLAFAWIQLLFLFAPLVIVPLGLELAARMETQTAPSLPERIARVIQGPAALLVVGSFFVERGLVSAGLASAWFVFCALLALGGLLRILRGAWRQIDFALIAASFLYLPIGTAWLEASRLGLEPLHFQEPIVLLTAVHFHYAGFAAPLLASSVFHALNPATSQRGLRCILRSVVIGVLIGPGLLAAAFVAGPRCKLSAALVLGASEIGLAACFLLALRKVTSLASRLLIGVAAASVVFSMVLAALWAVGEYPLQPFVGLGEMARFHGTANAFGFILCGLVGWILAAKSEPAKRSN